MGLSRANLTTIATRTGRKVVAAWSSRDAGAMGEVYGVVMHHTGSAWSSAVAPTLGIVQNGRSDLQNALCTFYIDKAGTIYLITEKIAWHAGQGSYRGITDGNGHFLGIEAESDGAHWTAETIVSYYLLVAEICRFLGADPNGWAIRHGVWATPKGRKTDFSGINETNFRASIAARLNGTPQEEDMALTETDVALEWYGVKFRGDLNYAQVIHGIDDGVHQLLVGQAAQAGQLAGLVELTKQLASASGQSLDVTKILSQIDAAVEDSVKKSIESIGVTVNVDKA